MPESPPSSTLLAEWLDQTTFPPAGTPIRCGVSGGADSLALLALAAASGCVVTAVHVDHGQRDTSGGEAALVRRASESVGASFEQAAVVVEPGSNLEARLRAARYGVLGPDAATGHTADDQAETMLINLLRGAGVAGLGAMRPGHRRPILGLRRADTIEICRRLGWEPFHDPSNTDPAFLRNRVRREVLPLLTDVAGRDVVPLLARTAEHARAAADELTRLAGELDPTDARAMAAAAPPVAAVAVQRWVRAETGEDHPIDAASVARVLAVASGDAVATEVAGGWRVVRSKQQLRLTAANGRQ